jgi:hypothetical protein
LQVNLEGIASYKFEIVLSILECVCFLLFML